jgi:hypothetical protein
MAASFSFCPTITILTVIISSKKMFLENVFLRVTNFLVAMPDSPFLE